MSGAHRLAHLDAGAVTNGGTLKALIRVIADSFDVHTNEVTDRGEYFKVGRALVLRATDEDTDGWDVADTVAVAPGYVAHADDLPFCAYCRAAHLPKALTTDDGGNDHCATCADDGGADPFSRAENGTYGVYA